jgi:hypothetical protein
MFEIVEKHKECKICSQIETQDEDGTIRRYNYINNIPLMPVIQTY